MSEWSSGYSNGDVFAGKYRIDGMLGTGGMGVVLSASHLGLGERVAIKVLHEDEASNPQTVGRLLREARAAARLKGEHGVRILDVGTTEQGVPFIVMEHLTGEDISQIIDRSGPLPVKLAVDYLLQACEALAEAHAFGIVHRDVKPSNVFVSRKHDGSDCVKVLDFGISKLTSPLDAMTPGYDLTQTRETMGTPQYMAPEQMRSSRKVDPRVDIWGLGTLLFVSLTGRPPFRAESMPELCAMILEDQTPSLHTLRPEVPPALDAIVQQCMMKRPEDRPQTALELARKLAPFASPAMRAVPDRIERVVGNLGPRGPLHSTPNPLALEGAAATIIDVPRGKRRLRIPWVAIVAVSVLFGLAGGGAFVLGRRSRRHANEPMTAAAPPSVVAPPPVASTVAITSASVTPVVPVVTTSDHAPDAGTVVTRAGRPRPPGPRESPTNSAKGAPGPPPPATTPAAPATATSRFD